MWGRLACSRHTDSNEFCRRQGEVAAGDVGLSADDLPDFALAQIEDGSCPQGLLASLPWETRVTPALTSSSCLITCTSGPGVGSRGSPTTNTSGNRCPAATRSAEQ